MPIPASSLVPSVDELKVHLNNPDDVDDAELQDFLDAAVELVEKYVGPIDGVQVTETHYGLSTRGPIVLKQTPVLEVTAIQDLYSNTWLETDWTVDGESGLLRLASAGNYSVWVGDITVTYTAGRTSLPGPVRLAILEVVRDMWAGTQTGGGTRPAFPGALPSDGGGFTAGRPALPPYAREMLEPYLLAPAVA